MASEAAKQVKMGFMIAAGFWFFGIVLAVIGGLVVRSMIQ